jgi:hypothetical protein
MTGFNKNLTESEVHFDSVTAIGGDFSVVKSCRFAFAGGYAGW